VYLDGKPPGTCAVPEFSATQATDCALGGSSHFGGPEFLAVSFAIVALLARALSTTELASRANSPPEP